MPSISISHKFTLRQNDYMFLLPVRFCNPHNGVCSQVWECLLDTGAHTSVIPEYISTDAGHSLMDGIGGASLDAAWGDSQQTYHHTFIVEIMDRDFRTVLHTLPNAIFDCTAGVTHEPILGADNFLKHFRIEFDYPAGIEIFPLPPYTPEMQPAERLWPSLQEAVVNRWVRTLDHAGLKGRALMVFARTDVMGILV